MFIWTIILGGIVLLLAARQLTHLLPSIPKRNEDFDAFSVSTCAPRR